MERVGPMTHPNRVENGWNTITRYPIHLAHPCWDHFVLGHLMVYVFFQPNNYPLAQCSQPQSARCDSKFYMIVDSNIVFIVQFHCSSIIPLIFLYSSIIVFLFLFYSYLQWQNHIRITSGHPVPIPAQATSWPSDTWPPTALFSPTRWCCCPAAWGGPTGITGPRSGNQGAAWWLGFPWGCCWCLSRAILWGYKCRDII